MKYWEACNNFFNAVDVHRDELKIDASVASIDMLIENYKLYLDCFDKIKVALAKDEFTFSVWESIQDDLVNKSAFLRYPDIQDLADKLSKFSAADKEEYFNEHVLTGVDNLPDVERAIREAVESLVQFKNSK